MSNVYSLQLIYFLSDILRKAKRVTTTTATATVIDDVLLLFRLEAKQENGKSETRLVPASAQ